MSSRAEAPLASFFVAARHEFERAAARVGESRWDLVFAGRRLRLRFVGHALADVLLPAFGARVEAAAGQPHATIDLWEERVAGHAPATPPWDASDVAPRGLVGSAQDADVLAVHELGSGGVTLIDRRTRHLSYRVPAADTLPWWERAAPLRSALFWALAGPQRGLVHAGAVGDERGGVLLAGAGGSGKTTVALAALSAGLSYVADDYLLLEASDPAVTWNLFATAKLDEGHLRRFPALAAQVRFSTAPEPDEKAELDVGRHHPQSLAESLNVRAVIVPSITGGHCVLRPISRLQALLALAPSTIFQMPFDGGAMVGVLSQMLRGLPCFALGVGDHPHELASAVEEVLDRSGGAKVSRGAPGAGQRR